MHQGQGGRREFNSLLAISTKVSVHPTNAIDRVLVLLKTMIVLIIRVERYNLQAFVSLQQNVGENVSGITRSDLAERGQGCAGYCLEQLQSFRRNEVERAFEDAAGNLVAALDEFSDAGASADGGGRGGGGGGGGGYDVT